MRIGQACEARAGGKEHRIDRYRLQRTAAARSSRPARVAAARRWVFALVACVIALGARPLAGAAHPPPPSPAQLPPQAFPARLEVTITGDPATPDFIAAQIRAAIAAAARSAGIAAAPRITLLPQPEPLESGFLTGYTALIDPSSGGSPAATAAIDVVNAGLPPFAVARLAFTDDPERITGDGVLSRTVIAADEPTRIYYYHQNTGERRRFCVVLSADGSVRSTVQIVGADAGPSLDVMSVGHAVSKAFLTVKPLDEGLVTTIAGGKPVVARDAPVAPGDVIAGALDVRVTFGGPVTVTVLAMADSAGADPVAFANRYAPQLPADGHDRHGLFDLAGFGRRIIAYTAGGPDAAYRYAGRSLTPPATDPSDPGHDFGDYGVLERITFDLANPGAVPATVYLYEKPLGGDVRSSFVVNGAIVDVGCVRVPQRYAVTSYQLGPHATAALDVLTMTDGGSNYPLEIGLTLTPPAAQTPPMSAPDGCFPKPKRAAQPPGGTPGR